MVVIAASPLPRVGRRVRFQPVAEGNLAGLRVLIVEDRSAHGGHWPLDRIRAMQGPLGTIPIIATTGERALPTAEVKVVSPVLVKPLDLDHLTSLLHTLATDPQRDH